MSVNGAAVETEGEFNDLLNALRVGDQVKLEVMRGSRLLPLAVKVESYDWPDVKLRPISTASPRQQAILASWQAGR